MVGRDGRRPAAPGDRILTGPNPGRADSWQERILAGPNPGRAEAPGTQVSGCPAGGVPVLRSMQPFRPVRLFPARPLGLRDVPDTTRTTYTRDRPETYLRDTEREQAEDAPRTSRAAGADGVPVRGGAGRTAGPPGQGFARPGGCTPHGPAVSAPTSPVPSRRLPHGADNSSVGCSAGCRRAIAGAGAGRHPGRPSRLFAATRRTETAAPATAAVVAALGPAVSRDRTPASRRLRRGRPAASESGARSA